MTTELSTQSYSFATTFLHSKWVNRVNSAPDTV